MSTTIQVPIELDMTEIYDTLLSEVCELGACRYWARDEIRKGVLILWELDHEGDLTWHSPSYTIWPNNVANAIGLALSNQAEVDGGGKIAPEYKAAILAIAQGDCGEMDVEVADILCQLAALGKVVYG